MQWVSQNKNIFIRSSYKASLANIGFSLTSYHCSLSNLTVIQGNWWIYQTGMKKNNFQMISSAWFLKHLLTLRSKSRERKISLGPSFFKVWSQGSTRTLCARTLNSLLKPVWARKQFPRQVLKSRFVYLFISDFFEPSSFEPSSFSKTVKKDLELTSNLVSFCSYLTCLHHIRWHLAMRVYSILNCVMLICFFPFTLYF